MVKGIIPIIAQKENLDSKKKHDLFAIRYRYVSAISLL